MRIHFVYPPQPYLVDPTAQVGLGLLSLATYAAEKGHDVSVQVAHAIPTVPETVAAMPTIADLVCLGGALIDVPVINDLAREIKQRSLAPCVVVGGPLADEHPTSIDMWHVDAIVQGPGEDLVVEFAKVGPVGRMLYRVKRLRQDINQYPFPDRRMIPEHLRGGRIYHDNAGVGCESSTTLLTSRGCGGACSFCRSACSKYEPYSLDRIEREVADIASLGITDIRVSDDNFVDDLSRADKIANILHEYNMRWRISVRAAVDMPTFYSILARKGCVEVSFGIESADQAVLDGLRKRLMVRQAKAAMQAAVDSEIPSVRGLLMMATPYDTPETLPLNKALVEEFPDVAFSLTVFYPFPGTPIRRRPALDRYWMVPRVDPNIYLFRADGSEPEAKIGIVDGMTPDQLTASLIAMRDFLVERGQHHPG